VRPFRGESTGLVFDAILNRAPVAPVRLNPDLPAELEGIINKALEKDRDLRYQHASDIRADLKRLKRDTDSGRSHASAAVEAMSSARTVNAKSWRGSHTLLWIVAAVAALALIYFLRPEMPPPNIAGTTQLTQDGVGKRFAIGSLNPPLLTDGSRIYFQEIAANQRSDKLMQVSTEGGEVLPVETPFNIDGLEDISPNRPELLTAGPPFTSSAGEDGLWALPLPGGQARRVGNFTATDSTWSRDGTALYYSTGPAIFRVNADGSQPRKILTTNGTPFWLRFSPDGSVLRFSVYHPKLLRASLWEARPDGSRVRELFGGWNNPMDECCGNWTSDGKYYIFQSTRDGVENLWAARETGDLWRKVGRKPVQLTVGQMSASSPLPSKDGTKVYFIGSSRRGELVRYDLKAHSFAPYLNRLSAEGLSFTNDGQRMAYVSFPEGVLWQSKADGSDRHELSFPPTQVGLPRWSPDGTKIAFSARQPSKTWQLFVIPAEGGDPAQLTSGDSDALDPSWSPDGNSLAFGGGLRSNENAIHVLNLKTRQLTTLPDSARLFSPRWSPDGRHLLALKVDSQALVVYDFTLRKWEDLTTKAASYPNWTHDGQCVYFDNVYEKGLPVYRICLRDRKLQHVVDLSQAGNLAIGNFGWWTGLGPEDSILGTRDTGIQEIYALETKFP
jgi:Tol biopolymer transport system component